MSANNTSRNRPFRVGEAVVLPASNEIQVSGRTIRIEPRFISILGCLAKAPGKPISRSELLDAAWDKNGGTDEGLTQAISHLRRLLGDCAKKPRVIETLPKRGYRLIGSPVPREAPHVERAVRIRGPAARKRLPIWTALAVCLLLGALAIAMMSDKFVDESIMALSDLIDEDPDYDFDIDFEDNVDPDP